MATKTQTKKATAPKATKATKPTITKATLQKAATMRENGKTWNEIREATKTRLGSSQFFRHWEREGIKHRPANTLKANAAKKGATAKAAKKTAAPKTTAKKAAPKVRTKATTKAA